MYNPLFAFNNYIGVHDINLQKISLYYIGMVLKNNLSGILFLIRIITGQFITALFSLISKLCVSVPQYFYCILNLICKQIILYRKYNIIAIGYFVVGSMLAFIKVLLYFTVGLKKYAIPV